MKNNLLKYLIIIILFCFKSTLLLSQDRTERGQVANEVYNLISQNKNFVLIEPFNFSNGKDPAGINNELGDYTCLELKKDELKKILATKPEIIELRIPVNPYVYQEFLLYKTNILNNSFELKTDKNVDYKLDDIVHYRGIIKNDEYSIAAFTFTEKEIMGFVSNNDENTIVGKLLNEERYVMYSDIFLVDEMNYNCDQLQIPNNTLRLNSNPVQTLTTNCVNFYYEADYDLFVNKGSVANVNSYIQAVFNQVASLYNNDGINISLSTIFVWTSTDPYTGPSTYDYLNQFGTYRTSFNGDLAHLVGLSGGGGIAYVSGLCANLAKYKMAYSNISSIYSIVPTYSWTVGVLSHEQGHLLGSPHTHDCYWNGNNTAIDGCGPTAGYVGDGTCPTGPLPSNGGTIMSYCHLLSNVGINFNNGFGPQPKNLIINNINNATCLSNCNPIPQKPDTILGPKTICTNLTFSAVYTCSSVLGATSYTWTLPSGWAGNSTTNSITVTNFGSSGRMYVKANNSYGSSYAETLYVAIKTIPLTPTKIKGATYGVCNTAQSYTVNKLNGITYNWSMNNAIGSIVYGQGTDSIRINFGNNFSDVTLTVNANNVCGTSPSRQLFIKTIPKIPDIIFGMTNPCMNQQNVSYNVDPVYNAFQYEWIVPFGSTVSDGIITSTTNKLTTTSPVISVDFGTNSTNGIRVKSINACGQSFNRTLPISFTCRNSINEISNLKIYPNPTTGSIYINFNTLKSDFYKSKIYDEFGRLILNKNLFFNEGKNQIAIDVSGFSNGYYRIELSNEQEYFIDKFIKMN